MTKRFSHPAWVRTQTSPLLVGFHLSPSLEKLDCWAAHSKLNSQKTTSQPTLSENSIIHHEKLASNSTILIGPNGHPTEFSCPKHSIHVSHQSLLSQDLGIKKKNICLVVTGSKTALLRQYFQWVRNGVCRFCYVLFFMLNHIIDWEWEDANHNKTLIHILTALAIRIYRFSQHHYHWFHVENR